MEKKESIREEKILYEIDLTRLTVRQLARSLASTRLLCLEHHSQSVVGEHQLSLRAISIGISGETIRQSTNSQRQTANHSSERFTHHRGRERDIPYSICFQEFILYRIDLLQRSQ